MSSLLEVIVTSVEESLEAEAGGADRLELLAAPEHAGLTPSLAVVESVLRAVSIRVRVMLRNNPSMMIENASELDALLESAAQFSKLPIDGLVVGFNKEGAVDDHAMRRISAAACGTPITFHRAFDVLPDKAHAIEALKQIPQVDRLLTGGGSGEWSSRVASIAKWQRAAAPQMAILFAVGRDVSRIADLRNLEHDAEVHVGRAARDPQTNSGAISRAQISAIKRALDGA
jgi:copper homeostasis protein